MELLFVLLGIAILICILSLWIVRNRNMRWETRTIQQNESKESIYDIGDDELLDMIYETTEEGDRAE